MRLLDRAVLVWEAAAVILHTLAEHFSGHGS
jgi:hypothetical protein